MKVTIAFVGIQVAWSFIARIPNCVYYGDFSSNKDHYFEGEVAETLQSDTIGNCTMACVVRENCVFLNYNNVTTNCELLSSHDGKLVDKPGWTFYTTNYSYFGTGPMCVKRKPCRQGFVCKDNCHTSLRHSCVEPNVAPYGVVIGSLGKPMDEVITSNYHNNAYTSTYNMDNPWVKVDLLKNYNIIEIKILRAFPSDPFSECLINVSLEDVGERYETLGVLGHVPVRSVSYNKKMRFIMIACSGKGALYISKIKAFVSLPDFLSF